jgi:hypothetical protein
MSGIQTDPEPATPIPSTSVAAQAVPFVSPVQEPANAAPTPQPSLNPTPPLKLSAVVSQTPAAIEPSSTPALTIIPTGDAQPTPAVATVASNPKETPSITPPGDSSNNQQHPISSVTQSTPDAAGPQPKSNLVATPTPLPLGQAAFVSDFFKIESILLLKKEPKSKIGVWHIDPPKSKIPPLFLQCLEVKVSARDNIRSDETLAKAYFFDERNNLVASLDKPSPSGLPAGKQFEMPVLFCKNKPASIFFQIPKEIKNWKAVVVFGDRSEAHTACFPTNETDSLVNYPEKQLVHNPKKLVARKPAMDPLIQYEVKTKNPRQPKITLFLRPPKGVSNADDVKGVLSLCILAGGIDDIKRALQKEEMDGDYNGLLGFANKHKLAILAWGSNGLWNPGANYEDLPKAQAQAMDKSFDLVADAWERGVHELGEKYGIPQKDFLLWGACGSAQWAHRLCLRKPDYFLAIDIHIPGSFDKPTPEASKVLWCLTTGELYGGYERSLRFVAACKKLGYPIVYKAIVGLGHSGHPDATAMGFTFFEFALKQKAARDDYDRKMASDLDRAKMLRDGLTPWPDTFRNPPFYGDIVNQEMYSSDQVAMIPEGFRIPLPTKEIAEVWARSH